MAKLRGDDLNSNHSNGERFILIGPYIYLILTNILFLPMLLAVAIVSLFYLSFSACVIGIILPIFLYGLINYLQLHYFGKNIPTDIRISQSKIEIKYLSPFKKNRTILKKNLQVIEFGREMRSIISRYMIAFITYRGIYYAYYIPNKVRKSIERKWSDVETVHSVSSLWIFSTYIHDKYRHRVGKRQNKNTKHKGKNEKKNKPHLKNIIVSIIAVFCLIGLTIIAIIHFGGSGIPSISWGSIMIFGCAVSILIIGISIPLIIHLLHGSTRQKN
ncbi:MAG: hypothetical protein ACMUHM_08175 [Thermoplasmatota archaeon]